MRKEGCRTTLQRVVEKRFSGGPRDSCWGLRGGGPGARIALLGWVAEAPSIDAGVPDQAVEFISRATFSQGFNIR